MNRRFDFALNALYFLALGLLIFIFIYMAYILIGLNFEGGIWFYQILNTHTYVSKAHGLRWSDLLWQLPTLFSVNFLSWVPLQANLYLLSATYTLHPLFCILLCYLLVRKEQNSFLYMTFPLLSMGSAVASNLSFVVGITNGAITFFWPLLFLLIFKGTSKPKYFLYSLVFTVLLSMNYEPAMIFFPILSFAVLKRSSFKLQKNDLFFLIAFTISTLFQILRVTYQYVYERHFVDTYWTAVLRQQYSQYYLFLAAAIAVFMISFLFYVRSKKIGSLFCGVLIGAGIFLIWSFRSPLVTLMESRENRSVAIPIAAAIALGLVYIQYYLPEELKKKSLQYIKAVSVTIFLASSAYLSRNILVWNEFTDDVHNVIGGAKGCIFLDNGGSSPPSTYTSLLLQKGARPEAIVFTTDYGCEDERAKNINPCDQYLKEDIFDSSCRGVWLPKGHIDNSQTKSQIIVRKSGKLFY